MGEVPGGAEGDTLEYERANASEREDDEEDWIASDVSFAIVCHNTPALSTRQPELLATRGYKECGKGGDSHTNGPNDNPFIHCPLNDAEQEQPYRYFDETDPRDEE